MNLSIKNFIACKTADLELTDVTFVTGKNEAGKSSICLAAAAALTGKSVPIDDLTKTNFPGLIGRKGEKTSVVLTDPIGSTTIDYPECTVFQIGSPLTISEHSSGMVSLANIPKKERALFVGKLLKTDPTEAELLTAVKSAIPGIEESFPALWKNIQATGWDGALAHCKEVGTRLKGKWETVTGDKFGTKKYLDWKPASFDDDFITANEADLSLTVKQDREWLEAAISETAVDSAQVAQLQKQADGISGLTASIKFISDELEPLEKSAREIRDGLAKLPRPENPKTQDCPLCKKPLAVEQGKIILPVILTEEEIRNRVEAISGAEQALADVLKLIGEHQNNRARMTGELKAAQAAAKKLSSMNTTASPTTKHATIDEMRKQLSDSELRLSSFQKWKQATEISEDIAMNLKLQEILDPTGIRLTKMLTALEIFNKFCVEVCESAGWPIVRIKDDMSIWQESYPYMLISDGAKFRARTVLQIAVAMIVGDKIVIIDKSDILDSVGRNGLLSIFQDFTSLQALIGMTYASRELVPNFGSLPGFSAYWMENGEAVKL